MKFQIPGALREFSGGRGQIEIENRPATVNQALSVLWTLCPGMRDRVVNEQGVVRPHINIFVGDENIRYSGGLATPLSGESVISIVPAVSGGVNSIVETVFDCSTVSEPQTLCSAEPTQSRLQVGSRECVMLTCAVQRSAHQP
jgi:sulfur-carrier protein